MFLTNFFFYLGLINPNKLTSIFLGILLVLFWLFFTLSVSIYFINVKLRFRDFVQELTKDSIFKVFCSKNSFIIIFLNLSIVTELNVVFVICWAKPKYKIYKFSSPYKFNTYPNKSHNFCSYRFVFNKWVRIFTCTKINLKNFPFCEPLT